MHERRTLRTALFVLSVVGLNTLVLVGWVMVTSMLGLRANPGFGPSNGAPIEGDWVWWLRMAGGWLVMIGLWGVLHTGLTVLVRRMPESSSSASRHVAALQPRATPRGRRSVRSTSPPTHG